MHRNNISVLVAHIETGEKGNEDLNIVININSKWRTFRKPTNYNILSNRYTKKKICTCYFLYLSNYHNKKGSVVYLHTFADEKGLEGELLNKTNKNVIDISIYIYAIAERKDLWRKEVFLTSILEALLLQWMTVEIDKSNFRHRKQIFPEE